MEIDSACRRVARVANDGQCRIGGAGQLSNGIEYRFERLAGDGRSGVQNRVGVLQRKARVEDTHDIGQRQRVGELVQRVVRQAGTFFVKDRLPAAYLVDEEAVGGDIQTMFSEDIGLHRTKKAVGTGIEERLQLGEDRLAAAVEACAIEGGYPVDADAGAEDAGKGAG